MKATRIQSSLVLAVQGFEDALRCLMTVKDPDGYRFAVCIFYRYIRLAKKFNVFPIPYSQFPQRFSKKNSGNVFTFNS
jgi:hypothetical protein